MKKKAMNAKLAEEHFGLVANGVAGSWSVDVDESTEGAQRWFTQIDGPDFYMNFQISGLDVIDEIARFLRGHMCPDGCAQRSTHTEGDNLVVSRFGATAVTLIWDTETHQRCFFLISANAGFHARLCVERSHIENVATAFDQVRDELRTDGMLPAISK
jgi:hypothetical protein